MDYCQFGREGRFTDLRCDLAPIGHCASWCRRHAGGKLARYSWAVLPESPRKAALKVASGISNSETNMFTGVKGVGNGNSAGVRGSPAVALEGGP